MRILLMALLLAQAPSGTRAPNNKYTIAVAPAKTAPAVGQAVADKIVERLSAKGYVKRPSLDVQCCTIQIEVLKATPLQVRIMLIDIDKQTAYMKVYTGEGAGKVAENALADKDFLKALAGI